MSEGARYRFRERDDVYMVVDHSGPAPSIVFMSYNEAEVWDKLESLQAAERGE
ncbi:MAG: hypothetical protein NVS3B1_30260 [Marmoricola sp.]